jgi:hypothetical protein
MSILKELNQYYSHYDAKTIKRIDTYIEKGGDLLAIFEGVENIRPIDDYIYVYSNPEKYGDCDTAIRQFNVLLMLIEAERIHKREGNWIGYSFEKEPEVAAYFYVLANFNYHILKGIRAYEVEEENYWYLNSYPKYKPYIDRLYKKTKDPLLKAKIQFCQYINDERQDSLEDIINNIPTYVEKMTEKNYVYGWIIYYLFKKGLIENTSYADKAFSISHKKLYRLASAFMGKKEREDFYVKEFHYMNDQFELSEQALAAVACSIVGDIYYREINFDKLIFSEEVDQKMLSVIKSLEALDDIAGALIFYAVLIKRSKEKDSHIQDFDQKLKRLIREGSDAKDHLIAAEDIIEGKKDKDLQLYLNYFKRQDYFQEMDMASFIMFGMSKIASNLIVFKLMGYRLLRPYVHVRASEPHIIKDLIDCGIREDALLSDIETNYFSEKFIRDLYEEYMNDDIEKYKERLLAEQDDVTYSRLFNKYYYDLGSKDLEVALEGLKCKYKSVQYLSRDYFLGKIENNDLLKELLKEKLPKANKELIEYIVDYNKLSHLDMEKTSLDDLVSEFYQAKKMDKAIQKLEISAFPKVRYKSDKGEASHELLTYYLATFLINPTVALPLTAHIIKAELNKEDLNQLGQFVYNKWFALGAEAKTKMAMVFAVYNCDEAFIVEFKKQIDTWTENSRGAIASEGIKAMAFHGSDYALMALDGISRKYKNKQVKNTASEYFLIAAKNMGLTREELADRVIPTLGFNKEKEIILDYGSRHFIGTLKEDLKIQLRTEEGKTIKSLPKANKSDDEDMVKATKKTLTALKKQLKTVVSAQTLRLERSIFIERRWDIETFNKVFVDNPIMHTFAVNLIWGKYGEDNQLLTAFRYMDDGTFANAEYDEIELLARDELGLVHPMDLSDACLQSWKENLEDNEITQPIKQLEIEIIEEDLKDLSIYQGFDGIKLPGISLVSKLEKQGWYKTSIVDGGGYSGLYIEFEELEHGAQISADELYIGMEEDEVTVRALRFYKSGTITRGSYVYDDIDASNSVSLGQVSPKFLNAVMTQLNEVCKK